METVKDKDKREWHIKCSGEVIRGICIKCGERKKGLISKILGDRPIVIDKRDEEAERRREHKKRIREGRDIFKL